MISEKEGLLTTQKRQLYDRIAVSNTLLIIKTKRKAWQTDFSIDYAFSYLPEAYTQSFMGCNTMSFREQKATGIL